MEWAGGEQRVTSEQGNEMWDEPRRRGLNRAETGIIYASCIISTWQSDNLDFPLAPEIPIILCTPYPGTTDEWSRE